MSLIYIEMNMYAKYIFKWMVRIKTRFETQVQGNSEEALCIATFSD